MLEELRETVLTDLEKRVERAIGMIEQLRQDKFTLESQISELHEQIQQTHRSNRLKIGTLNYNMLNLS